MEVQSDKSVCKARQGRKLFSSAECHFQFGLSTGELAVYAYLMYCEDRKSHQCWPSYKTIGEAVGMSRNTVQKYVRELEYKALIITEPTKYESESGHIRNGNLIFTILSIQGAVNHYNESQSRK